MKLNTTHLATHASTSNKGAQNHTDLNDPIASGIYLGLLSGTSLDSIDVAAVKFNPLNMSINDNIAVSDNIGNKCQILASLSYPLPIGFKDSCLEISRQGNSSIDQIGKLDHQAGVLFSQAVNKLLVKHKISANSIVAIGSHGQTIRHQPNLPTPFSTQIGDPNIIAQHTKITTIADFRRRDIAAGGQGAPLAPAFHAAMFNDDAINQVVVNIGGMTNITSLNKGKEQNIIGFDTGPGNCLLDYWCKLHFKRDFDQDGEIALNGKIEQTLLRLMLADPFFAKPPPKTTGHEYFNPQWLADKIKQTKVKISPADIQATLTKLTSITIGNAIKQLNQANEKTEVYICGGGAYNKAILTGIGDPLNLRSELYKVTTTDSLGIPPQWVEAGLFAWLARQCLLNIPASLPSVTGAKAATVLGGIYPSG